MARVPQKNRIREKLGKARDPFFALQNTDPGAAEEIGVLLKNSRDAFAAERFDESERYVDAALAAMGVAVGN